MWRSMFSKNSVEHRTTIRNAEYLPRFQQLCEQYGFVPTYFVDYEMAGSKTLQHMAEIGMPKGKLEIGMHMHAWTAPPYYEFPPEKDGTHGNPYIGEYPTDVIKKKVDGLLSRLQEAFHLERITSHRSGRWYLDARYVKILHERGVFADASVTPGVDWSSTIGQTRESGGPDYRGFPHHAYEMDLAHIGCEGTSGFYEIPVTISVKDHIVTWLRPNRNNLSDMLDLVQEQSESRASYLEFMIHSTELMPFGSPTFQTDGDIEKLYQDMETLFERIAKEYQGIGLSDYVRMAYL